MATISEEAIFQMILHGGNGKSCTMEAIMFAKKGDMEIAEEKLKEAEAAINEAHHIQTELIQEEVRGNHSTITLLMVHAQDHLMTSITIKDLAREFVDMYKLIASKD